MIAAAVGGIFAYCFEDCVEKLLLLLSVLHLSGNCVAASAVAGDLVEDGPVWDLLISVQAAV